MSLRTPRSAAAVFALLTAGAVSVFATPARAESPGCANFNASTLNGPQTLPMGGNVNDTITGPFTAGEVLRVTVAAGGDDVGVQFDLPSGSLVVSTTVLAFDTQVFETKVPTGGAADAFVDFADVAVASATLTATLACVPVSEGELARQRRAAAIATAEIVVTTATDLIANRIGGLLAGATPPLGAEPPAAANASALSGAGGQGASTPVGVWANMGYSGLSSSDAAARVGVDVLTGVAGVDMTPHPNIVFGGALALSWADTDTPDDAFAQDEFGVMFAPYIAYAITDVFAVDGSIGYGVGFSATETANAAGRAEGDAVNHRYFVSMNATGREYWGPVGLLGSVGMLWSQNFQGAYTESDGDSFGSERIDLGRVTAQLQPSYLFTLGDDYFLEPFIGIGYSYDYRLTKVAGAANDRDHMDAKLGANLFADGVFGAVEATTGLFRENQRSMAINGTLRMNF